MDIDNFRISLADSRRHCFEDELLRARNLEECQILRRRPHENEVVVLGIVEREEAATLDADFLVKQIKGVVQAVNRQHFTDACIVVKYLLSAISRRVEVPDSHVGHTYEGRIAENHQRLLRAGQKSFPENVQSHWRFRGPVCRTCSCGTAREKAVRRHRHDRSKSEGQYKQQAEPSPRRL